MVRKGSTMGFTVVAPGSLICLIGLLYYIMPRGGGERINFLMIVLLTEIMFLVILASYVPLSNQLSNVEILFFGLAIYLCMLTVPIAFLDYRTKLFKKARKKMKNRKKERFEHAEALKLEEKTIRIPSEPRQHV